MKYKKEMNVECYFPPVIGNGEISVAVDCEGALNYNESGSPFNSAINGFHGVVVRCGRRTNMNASVKAELFSFGKIKFSEGSEIVDWSQDLIKREGCVKSVCDYADGVQIETTAFIHPKHNIYAINKTFKNAGDKEFAYEFILDGYREPMSELYNITNINCVGNEVRIAFKMYGADVYTGEIRLCVNKPCKIEATEKGAILKFKPERNESITLFYYLEDDFEVDNYITELDNLKNKISKFGFYELLDECREDYRAYFEEGYVKTSNEKLNNIYETALYILKCWTTKYSIPVGLCSTYWGGRFFAFDEYYSYLGLLTSNRKSLAKHVPEFRLNICLPTAIKYASDCHKNADTVEMAKFIWETGEKSDVELSPIGVWLDHIFHMPVIGIGAFEYYEYTGDKEALSRYYRMIRACAKYFTNYMVYHDGDRTYIGKCCDLERLGAAVENPFMTSCGAIKLLECCAEASEILEIDEEYREECIKTAKELRKSLPVENGIYVPHKGCKQKSVAVFAGKFPFNTLSKDDEKMLSAWKDFEENGAKYGNMYPMGKSISPWYACWKAEAYARVGLSDKAYAALEESFRSAGVFDELFEVNEDEVHMRPWFTTAHGIYLSAVNEMLVQSDDNTITLLPAFPIDKDDISFKLAVKNGATVEAKFESGQLVNIYVDLDGKDVTKEYEIFYMGIKIN